MKFLNQYRKYMLCAPEGDGAAGGGGAPPAPKDGDKGGAPPDPAKALADLQATNATLLARLEALEGKKPAPPNPDDSDLVRKAREQRESDDKSTNNTKALEAAITFNMNSDKFLKDNSALLPKDIADIFAAANKENYSSATEKAAAIKAGVLQSFFAVQANLDLLTPGLKSQLEDYLKLTNTGKQQKALQVYDSIFEPAFEMARRLKKAEALGKGHSGSNADDAYKNKMVELSKKHYLGETK